MNSSRQNQCDHGHSTKDNVKLLSIGECENVIVCYHHYCQEIKYRKERNKEIQFESNKFDLPEWNDLKVYDLS